MWETEPLAGVVSHRCSLETAGCAKCRRRVWPRDRLQTLTRKVLPTESRGEGMKTGRTESGFSSQKPGLLDMTVPREWPEKLNIEM